MSNEVIKIQEVSVDANLLESVIQLWRSQSDTLGFMPRGAFEQAARSNCLWAAIGLNSQFYAYVLFRPSKGGIKIAHLCVKPEAQGRGLARLLVNEITHRFQDSTGIGLWCREDFPANKLWPKLGFSPRSSRRGRGSAGSELILWVKDHANIDLFSGIDRDDRVEAVIDTCVYFDIVDSNQTPRGEESRALISDWLQDSLRLLISQEVRNDMHRDKDAQRKKHREKHIGTFDELRINPQLYENALTKIKAALPPATDDQTDTDYRHIAWTLASQVPYFLTRDGPLLKYKPTLQELGINLLTPGEFIRRIDELDRKELYRPEEIAGTKITFLKVHDNHIPLVEKLADRSAGESPRALVAIVRKLMANPRQSQIRIAVDATDTPLALIGEESIDSTSPTVSLSRLNKSNFTPTLAQFIAHKLIREKSGSNTVTYRVTDPLLPDTFKEALVYCGFQVSSSASLVRPCRAGLLTWSEAEKEFGTLPTAPTQKDNLIWPVKITDSSEPVYMISINPSYASNLFDHELASQTLFSANPDVLLQDECVYYSGTKNQLHAPGRILWYVSQGDGYDGTMAVRACSYLIESVKGPAKKIFRQFKRFGVFEWKQVLDLAGATEGEVTAIRFSNTETFPNHIPLSEMLHEIGSAPAGPRPISYDLFLKLYRTGMGR